MALCGAGPPRAALSELLRAVSDGGARARALALAEALAAPGGAGVQDALAGVRRDLGAAHGGAPPLRRALEALLVAALGCADAQARDDAVVLLNVLYDGHTLQLDDALPVTVAEVGEGVVQVAHPVPIGLLRNCSALFVKTYVSSPGSVAVPALAPRGLGDGAWATSAAVTDIGVQARERSVPIVVDAARKVGTIRLGPFGAPGYVDWIVSSSDARDLAVLNSRRVAGRFVVQRRGARREAMREVPVDEVGATWDEKSGHLCSRGSFDAVHALVPEMKASGTTAVYLMGALERSQEPSAAGAAESASEDGEETELSSTPFVVSRRDVPSAALGGADAFGRLVETLNANDMSVIVDGVDRVSKLRSHRYYAGLHVSMRQRNTRGGFVLVPHPGTDSMENQWDETVLLNFRDVNVWASCIHDVKVLAQRYGVRGVRLDNAQSAPLIMAMDEKELFRVDDDGVMHYPDEDRILGRVVRPNVEQGYWSSDAAVFRGYPNPFLVKVCRELWAEFPDFVVIAESHFHREAQLASSGCIPHSIRVPQILASINGKSVRRNGSVVKLPADRRSTAKTLSRLFKTDRVTMPKNYMMLGCTCTHLSPYPAVLYGRRSWLAVDFLYFLPHVPMLLYREDAGRAYRQTMAAVTVADVSEVSDFDVNFDAVLPKSPKKSNRGNSPVGGMTSLGNALSSPGPSPGVTGSALLPPALSSVASHGLGGSHAHSGGKPDREQNGYHDGGSSRANGETGANPVYGMAMGIGSVGGSVPGTSRVARSAAHPGTVSSVNGFTSHTSIRSHAHSDSSMQNGFRGNHAMTNGGPGHDKPSSAVPRGGKGGLGMRRRGSTSSLGLKLQPNTRSSSRLGMLRSMSREDMKGLSVRDMSSEELRKMDALESAARADIGPETGYDLSQIKAHYSHRALLRQEHPVLRDGEFCVLSPDPASRDNVFSFARFSDTDLVIVAANLRDSRDGAEHGGGIAVDLDMRVLWDEDIGLPEKFSNKFSELYKFVNLFTGADHLPGEYFTLEEIVFRKLALHVPPLGIVVLRVCPVNDENSNEFSVADAEHDHFTQCLTRLQESDASTSLKDARENYAVASIARGASTSLSAFATALEKVRAGLENEGCDGSTITTILQFCLQRASALIASVVYEHVTCPKDFDPPRGEQISSYLALLSTVSTHPELLETTRQLVVRSSKIGPLAFLTAELGRFSTAGGLGVMVDELTKGLVNLGLEVYVVSPYYAVNRKNEADYLGEHIKWTRNMTINVGTDFIEVGVFEGVEDGVNLIFLERKDYFSKVYANPGTSERHLQTIVLMSLGSLEVFCQKAITPSMIITNDWLPSMAAGYARNGHFGDYFATSTFMHLIHNLGDLTYEGRCFPEREGDDMGYIHRLPRHCVVDPMWSRTICNPSRTALLCSDNWGTVSPSYMKELLSGHDLSPLLQMARQPFAYPNGIPMADRQELLRTKGAIDHLSAKAILQKRYFNMDVPQPDVPLFAFVGRVTSQKGVHLILNAVEELIRYTEGKIQILVGGPANYQDPYAAGCAGHMHDLRYRHPLCFWAAPEDFFTDGPLVNLGSDFGVMPSAFEPGGIVQQEFFVAGTPVIAFKTGGLKDTVHEWQVEECEGNGFLFDDYNHDNFARAMKRALHCFGHPEEYAELRASAYTTTIDVSQVAWAWSSEFHRMRNAIYSRTADLEAEVRTRMRTELEAAKQAGVVADTARIVELSWTGKVPKGETVSVKGSWDEWTVDYVLKPATDRPAILVTELLLPAGEFTYKFRVGGEWMHAEDRPTKVSDGAIQAVNNVLSLG